MPKLLIVDDDESVRKVLGFRLKNSYEIIETGSPEEALALALQEKPDAILLDLMMPKYSGFEVCQTISSLSFTSHIPIIIVSGESSANYREFCESLGAKDFIQKPVNFEALESKLRNHIDRCHKEEHGEPRVRLRVMLKLRPAGASGGSAEVLTATETVSANGFLCGYQGLAENGALMDVFFVRNGQHPVGRARVARVEWPGTPGQQVDFTFLEKPSEWVLR